jgi:uncharacterized protein YndB with AHSA1/START domain
MSIVTETAVTTKSYQAFIKATPEAIWAAITQPEWTGRYGYGGRVEYDLRPGGEYRAFPSEAMKACGVPDVILEGEVLEADPPRKLVQTWDALFDADIAAEPATILTWELEEAQPGVTKVTVSHELEGAPRVAALVTGSVPEAGGGWPFVLSDLKTLLETGSPLAG